MAHARFGRDSDVDVYEDACGGFTCERCPRVGSQFRCDAALATAEHLAGHRARGDRVPDDAIEELRAEGRGA